MRKYAPLILLLPLAANAQSDDRDYLTALIEDSLSGAGRQVTITGFSGALSSQASIESLTIADDQGIWLTLNKVKLDWSRAALLSGEVSVNELSAAEIILDRTPTAPADTPAPEAGGFALPDLPVSVHIGKLAADHIELGADVLGTALTARLDAGLNLADGAGDATLTLQRTDDGPAGQMTLTASFDNTSRNLAVELALAEDAGGIGTQLLGIPGAPAIDLAIAGDGPLSDFAADIRLASDGAERLAGTVTLAEGDDNTRFAADLHGNLAPLWAPGYADFFGPEVSLTAIGDTSATGGFSVDALSLTTQALQVNGGLQIGADGLPRAVMLRANLAQPDGQPVLLPLSGDPVRVQSARMVVDYDAAKGDDWRSVIALNGLQQTGATVAEVSANGTGTLTLGEQAAFAGGFDYAAKGLVLSDPALARAVGDQVSGKIAVQADAGTDGLRLPVLALNAQGLGVSGAATVSGLSDALRVSGQIRADIADLSVWSAVAGQGLTGAADIALAGNGSALAGDFDLSARVAGRDMGLAQRPLRGESTLSLSAKRDATGTHIRQFDLQSDAVKATATGVLASAKSAVQAQLDVADMAAIAPGFRGALSAKVDITGTMDAGTVALAGNATDLRLGQEKLDPLLRGATAFDLGLALRQGVPELTRAAVKNPQLSVTAENKAGVIDLTARLANLGVVLPDFPGAVAVSGQITNGDRVGINLRATGPGGLNTTLAGDLARDGSTANLRAKGGLRAELLAPLMQGRVLAGPVSFDLAIKGPLQPQSVSGSIALSGGRLADPALAFALQDISAKANLRGGAVQIDAATRLSTGGQISATGQIGMAPPYAADLNVALQSAVLRDPALFQTTANGALTLSGPLTGGAMLAGEITLRQTELQIPQTGFGGGADLPGLRHVAEAGDVTATRARAGLITDAPQTNGTGSSALALDLTINAPDQIFLRGRGLDAELGGMLILRGSTANILPSGSFDLIRGRLEILGERLDLTKASLLLEGDFIPSLSIAASSTVNDVITTVGIEGPATSPVVSFTSTPELPEEEVLALLLFGRPLDSLSAVQAAQLANAVATLAGSGGVDVVGRLRQSVGLDDLDVQTDDSGATSVKAGKYLTENIYSEVQLGQDGSSQVNLNLDLTDSITLRGKATSLGETGVGVFFEQDY